MRIIISFLAIALLATGASAQQDTLKYRISLKDKAATTYSLEHPEAFLSEKAIADRFYRLAGVPQVRGRNSPSGRKCCGYR